MNKEAEQETKVPQYVKIAQYYLVYAEMISSFVKLSS